MSKYIHIIPGRDFRVIDTASVNLVKKLANNVIPQHGIRYIGDDAILQSNSIYDILDAVRNGCWAHSTKPSRIKEGHQVYIVPNNSQQKIYGPAAIGITFTAASDVYTEPDNENTWISNT